MTVKSKTFTYAVTSPLTTGVVVTTGPAKLHRVHVNTALSAHAVTLNNRTTAMATLPASAPAGASYAFDGMYFNDQLRVAVNAAGTGSITVMYSE